MKVLFMPLPGIGHAFPMVPLAWAMRAAGHEVHIMAGIDALELRNAGFPVIDPIPGVTMEDQLPEVLEEAPDLFQSMSHLSIEQILALKPMVVKPWDRFIDPYVTAAREVKPDLIVYDPVFAAGLIAAAALDVPTVGHGYMLIRFTPELVHEHAVEAFRRHGVDLPKRIAVIDAAPASIMESGPSTWAMQYIPYNGGGVLPQWLAEPPTRPRIAVTLGTVSPQTTGTGRFNCIIEAAAEVDAEFALTVSHSTAANLPPLPDNVRPTGWVPLYQLLGTCNAIIHHGGSGTMFTSTMAGLPQLIMPEGADNDYNGRILRSYGCALTTEPGQIDVADIQRLITDPDLQLGADRLRQEFAQLPTPSALVDEIRAFARS